VLIHEGLTLFLLKVPNEGCRIVQQQTNKNVKVSLLSNYEYGGIMKRLMIMTVGKTHSGKTTFARALEKELNNSFVMDQDNHVKFINAFYDKLQPTQGPNTLKHAVSRLIVDYAIENTNLHIIVCNSNRSRKGRLKLLEELFNKNQFVRILVHFDIPSEVLQARVTQSQRSTNIFRGLTLILKKFSSESRLNLQMKMW
jgi:predicted kinase